MLRGYLGSLQRACCEYSAVIDPHEVQAPALDISLHEPRCCSAAQGDLDDCG